MKHLYFSLSAVILLAAGFFFFLKPKEDVVISKSRFKSELSASSKKIEHSTNRAVKIASHHPICINESSTEDYSNPIWDKESKEVSTSYKFAVGAVVTSGPSNPTGEGKFTNIGPFGIPEVHWTATGNGAVNQVAIHPTNPAIMYASIRNGGLAKSTNYGRNWTFLSDNFGAGSYAVAISKSNPSIIYASLISGLWSSNDEGVTWTNISNTSIGTVRDIEVNPTNPLFVIVAGSYGLYKTADGGKNWYRIKAGNFHDISVVDDWSYLAAAVTNGSPMAPTYVASKDKGLTWNPVTVTTDYTLIDKIYLAINKVNNITNIYALVMSTQSSNPGPSSFAGLYLSTNQGVSFTKVTNPNYTYPNGPVLLSQNTFGGFTELLDEYGSINPPTDPWWSGGFFVDPKNKNNLISFDQKLWTSNDGGLTWNQRYSYGNSNWADDRYFTTNAAQDTIFFCNDGGVWACATTDMFAPIPNNSKIFPKIGDLAIQEGGQCDVSLLNKGVYIVGGQDLGQFFTRRGRDTHVASADVFRGRICPFDDTKFITGYLSVKVNGVDYKLNDNIEAGHFDQKRMYGFTIEELPLNAPPVYRKLLRSAAGENAWVVQNPGSENVANTGGHSWMSTVSNWEEFFNPATFGITTIYPGTFEESWANPNFGLFGDEQNRRVFITNNLTAAVPTWTQLTTAPALSQYRFATHPLNENLIVIASKQGVHISKNKGLTWSTKPGFTAVEDPIQVLVDKNTAEGIYVKTYETVFYTDETLTSWIKFNKFLPNDNLQDMRMVHYPNGDSRLYVCKYGRGMWESPLYSVIKNKKAMSDFDVHALSSTQNVVNGKVTLFDLSTNRETISWRIEHASAKFSATAGNVLEPQFALPYSGYYHVTQTAYNPKGDSTLTRKNFLFVEYPGSCTTYQNAKMSIVSVDSETSPAANVIDGSTSTAWVSSSSGFPHVIQFKLQDQVIISLLKHTPRASISDGRIADYQIYFSLDGINWGDPVATGKLNNIQYTTTINTGSKPARYVKFVALSEVSGKSMAAISEISLCTYVDPFATTAVEGIVADKSKIAVFPNPNKGKFHLQYTADNNEKLEVIILNSLGRIVYNRSFEPENQQLNADIDASFLPKGIYVVQVKQNSKVETQRIVIK